MPLMQKAMLEGQPENAMEWGQETLQSVRRLVKLKLLCVTAHLLPG